MIVKIQVAAIGSLGSYINKPVFDRIPITKGDNRKEIGKILDAKVIEDGYELTINIKNMDLNCNLKADKVMSLSMEII